MVIRRKQVTTAQPYDDMLAYLDSQQEIVNEIVAEETDNLRPTILDELQTEPPKPTYPLRWASDRQRRAFFATDGFGKGIPYKRTGKLANAWVVEVTTEGDGAKVVIENPAPEAKFVYGSLAQNTTQALRFQQPFHQDTGWQAATLTVTFWFEAIQERIRERFDNEFAEFGKSQTRQRAFTR